MINIHVFCLIFCVLINENTKTYRYSAEEAPNIKHFNLAVQISTTEITLMSCYSEK